MSDSLPGMDSSEEKKVYEDLSPLGFGSELAQPGNATAERTNLFYETNGTENNDKEYYELKKMQLHDVQHAVQDGPSMQGNTMTATEIKMDRTMGNEELMNWDHPMPPPPRDALIYEYNANGTFVILDPDSVHRSSQMNQVFGMDAMEIEHCDMKVGTKETINKGFAFTKSYDSAEFARWRVKIGDDTEKFGSIKTMNEMDDMDSEPSFQEGLRSLCKMAGVELSGDEDGHENEPVDVKMKEVKVAPMNVIPSINIASKTSSVDDGGYEGMETRSASPQELEDLYPADYRGSPELDVVQEFVMPADMTIEININKLLEELKKADPFENQNSNKRHQLSDVKKKILDHHDLRRRLEIRDNERDEHIKMGVEFLQYRAELTSRMPENKLAMVSTKVLTCLKNMLEITFSEMLLSLACFMEITASHSRKFEDYLHLEKDLIIQILPEIEFMV